MKIGLLADIHGNDLALSAVLTKALQEGVTELLVAGDIVGYYYNTGKVIEMLDDFPWFGVQGNHEWMLKNLLDGSDPMPIYNKYGSSLNRAINTLPADQLERLCVLPHPRYHTVADCRIVVCHGSIKNRDRYIYPDSTEEERRHIHEDNTDLLLYGHTHYPIIWRGEFMDIVNPGSVGQPRDRKGGACWALYDTRTKTVELRRENYDLEPLIRQCYLIDPHLPYLHKVLTR
jgi:putative phosphoesterase